ncbi:MFS transporter [Neorhizobium sp. NCHU2750]|uniref:MFS transporter n=1 Tax=Neorhizobium sp. NCHU2750 TaxID=1825976 RepID=UPI000E70C54D|nr:multidrug transporter [Neorhizobium sp. NCHU2750]
MRQIVLFLSPLWRNPQIAAMVVLTTFIMSGVGLVSPILSVYAATFSASATMAGMIITLFGVGRLIINLPAGILSQRFGHRILLMAGPFILVVGSIVAALATNLDVLLLARFVQGIGSGIYMTVSSAAIATLAEPGERGRLMALYQGGMLIGTGLGPAIGGLLASHFGYSAPFWAYALVCIAALFIAWSSVGHDDNVIDTVKQAKPAAAAYTTSLSILRDMPFLLVCIINFGVFFTRTASQWQAIPLLAHQRYAMGVDEIGLALSMLAVMNFVSLPLTGMLVDRYGARRLTFASTIVTAIALVWIGFGDSVHMLWIGVAVLGIGGGLNGPATAAYAAEIVPVRQYGPAMGLMRTFGDAGFVIGPIMIGSLADFGSFGSTGGLLANALLMAIAGLAFLTVGSQRKSRTTPVQAIPTSHDSNKDQIA